MIPTFDFECFSAAGFTYDEAAGKWRGSDSGSKKTGLPLVGSHNYVNHPSFEIISLSYDLRDGRGMQLWLPDLPPPQDLLDHIAAGGPLEAWNVGFERKVWDYYCVPVLGWPPLPESQVRCAMATAAANGYPRSLEAAGEVLGLTERKDKAGKALIRKLTVPRNPTKANPALRVRPIDDLKSFLDFYQYNAQDVRAEMEASSRMAPLCARELEIWRVDQRINRRGMQIDTAAVDACLVIVEAAYAKYNGRLREITGGAVQSASEVAKTIGWLSHRGGQMPTLDEDDVADALKRDYPPAVLEVLRIRQALAFGSVRKLYAMRAQTCADGRLRDQYAYHGAHTGLWNGQGVQVANLYKGKLDKPEKVEAALAVIRSGSLETVEAAYGDALECVADCLRSMITAGPGKRLIASDFSAIQAVVTSALAGEKWRLDVFHTHGKIYEAMASQLTGNPLEYYLQYRREHGKHHDHRQTHGKLPVLSGDFGAWINGWKRFGADEILGCDDNIKAMILKTRASIPNIVEFWGGQTRNKFNKGGEERAELYGLEGAAISAVLHPGECYGYRSVRYQMQGDTLYCQPPGDGAPLQYHAPRLEPSTRDYARPWELALTYEGWDSQNGGKWLRQKLYGGACTQNVVSKVAREFQADALMALDATGIYLPVAHTHDEIVTEVVDGVGNIAEYLGIVNRGKPWAIDDWGRPWPIKVPGADETHLYGKWES